VPSLTERYFDLAAQRGLATGSLSSCVGAAATLETIGDPLLPACAPAAISGAPLVPCGPTATDRLTCGSRTQDLALALSGQAPRAAWLTRFVGRIPAGTAADDVVVTFGPGVEAPMLRVAAARCSGSGVGSSGGGGGGGGASGDGYESGSYGGGCGGGAVTVADGTTEGGDDCDSSSSSSSSGDDCDSGSSSSAGDDCDSGASSGDDCDSGAGADDCDSAAPKKRTARGGRSPVSRAVLGFAFLLLPLRRWTRRRS
jgi:hypothetical protein